jgi:4-hydroxythreonine-4-phosphate dehydrogenase
MPTSLPKIAITMGDAAGVGPELCLRLLADLEIAKICTPIVFGDRVALAAVSEATGLPLPTDDQSIVSAGLLGADQLKPGKVNGLTGAASFAYINAAIDAALVHDVDAVVTCPIHKEAWHAAGIPYPGHTELFAARQKTDRFCMMMTAPAFSCSLVTTHCGYSEVPQQLTTDLILEVTELTHDALKKIYGRTPKLAMLALNPDAGYGGLFGNREEETIIAPAVKRAHEMGIEITHPLPPDTAFLPSRREQTDGYICMYHDQGLIPFKAFNFDTGVNITLGLPIVRTSVDHGTALDIAWKGIADVSSLVAAVQLAAKLAST